MTPKELIQRRLANQRLATNEFTTPEEVVNSLGAVQAQDFSGALWALGLRLPGTNEGDIEDAFAKGSILRTHVLRPTWHFVTPADIRWMLALTAPRVKATMVYVNRRVGLSAADFKRSNKLIEKTLEGSRQLTRSELAFQFKKAGLLRGGEEPLKLAHLMMEAELDALVTSGPRRGKQFTYMLMHDRAPHTKPLARDEALAEMARRYFNTRGPATAKDFSWWSGLAMADCRAAIAALGKELVQENINGSTAWFTESRPAPRDASKQAYLLPNYDEYGIGFTDRSAIYDPEEVKKLEVRDRPVFSHIVVVNGRAEGTWKRELGKGEVRITLSLFRTLTKAEMARVAAAAKRYGEFLGLKSIVLSA